LFGDPVSYHDQWCSKILAAHVKERFTHVLHAAEAVALDRGEGFPTESDVKMVSERAWNAPLPSNPHHSEALAEAHGAWQIVDSVLGPEIPPWERIKETKQEPPIDLPNLGRAPYTFISKSRFHALRVEERSKEVREQLHPGALALADCFIQATKDQAEREASANEYRDPSDFYWIDEPPEQIFRKNAALVEEWDRKRAALDLAAAKAAGQVTGPPRAQKPKH